MWPGLGVWCATRRCGIEDARQHRASERRVRISFESKILYRDPILAPFGVYKFISHLKSKAIFHRLSLTY